MQKEERKRIKISTWINIFVLAIFTFVYLYQKNYEFLLYIVTLGFLIFVVEASDRKFNYSIFARYGLSIWLFLHMAGGSFKVLGVRLYDLILIDFVGEPFNLLRYDQFVHFYCYLVITFFVLDIAKSFSKNRNFYFYLIVALAGTGIGAVNEIIEFSTVAFFNAEGVGNYFNNALDLVFNLLGSIIAVWIYYARSKK